MLLDSVEEYLGSGAIVAAFDFGLVKGYNAVLVIFGRIDVPVKETNLVVGVDIVNTVIKIVP